MSCIDELTEPEHAALVVLSRYRNRNTKIVRNDCEHIDPMHLDALIELGYVVRSRDRLKVLIPCPGHSIAPDEDVFLQNLSTQSRDPNYNDGVVGEGGGDLSIDSGPQPGTGGSHSSRYVVERATARQRAQSIRELVDEFDQAMRVLDWRTSISLEAKKALGANFKRWIDDGDSPEMISVMIDIFARDLKNNRKPAKYAWKQFIVRRGTLTVAYRKHMEAVLGEEHRHDPAYWGGPVAVQQRERERMEKEAAERERNG